MKKILYITNGIDGPGGLERVLSIKTDYFINNYNYEIHIITLNKNIRNTFYPFNSKIIFHIVDISLEKKFRKKFYKYKNAITKIISITKPQIISVCDDGLKGLLFPIFFKTDIPLIYERHASLEIFNNSQKKSLFNIIKFNIIKKIANFGASKFDKFVVLTQNNKLEWNLSNISIIPNPLSFYPNTSSKLKNKKVISVGSHSYNKGTDRLISIWEQVVKFRKGWELHIYGKSNSNFDVKKMVMDKNLSKSVFLFAPVKNIESKLLDASIFVLPSRSEGFGMVLIEAMSCGLPSIAYDCPGGPQDIITNGVNGFLINDDDVDSFVQTLLNLIDNYDVRLKIGNNAKQHVQKYKIKYIADLWKELFDSL